MLGGGEELPGAQLHPRRHAGGRPRPVLPQQREPGRRGGARAHRARRLPRPCRRDPKSDYFDPRASDEDPRWFMVDVAFEERFPALVSLDTLRETPGLEKMLVINRSRLSVQPVTEEEFETVVRLGRGSA
ncbi:MAG TPA: EVE domain-containing protein [Longimicrobium sp.]